MQVFISSSFVSFIISFPCIKCLCAYSPTPELRPRTSTTIHDLASGRLLPSSHLAMPSCPVPRTESSPEQPECSLSKRKLRAGFLPLCLRYFRKLVNSPSALCDGCYSVLEPRASWRTQDCLSEGLGVIPSRCNHLPVSPGGVEPNFGGHFAPRGKTTSRHKYTGVLSLW